MNNVQDNEKVLSGNKKNKEKRRAKHSAAFVFLVIFAFLCTAVLSVVWFFMFYMQKPQSVEIYTVPKICGIELDEAVKMLEENKMNLVIAGSGAGTGEQDVVVWQSIPQGSLQPANGTVEVWIERAAEDNWSWTEKDTTLERLSASDINYKIEYVNEPAAADGLVTNVRISGSDAEVYVNELNPIKMPDLSGMSENEAFERLQKLNIAYVKNVKSDAEEAAGTVLSQYPQAGDMIYAGDTALVTVCIGRVRYPMFEMEIKGEKEYSINAGQSIFLSVDILPDAAGLNEVIWISSDSAVAKVEPTGKVTATGVGSAVITAEAESGAYKSEIKINVSEAVTGIEIIEKSQINWLVGDEFSAQGIRVAAYTSGGNIIDISDECVISGADLSREGKSLVSVEYKTADRTISTGYDINCAEPSLDIDVKSVILGINDRHTINPVYSPAYADVRYYSSDEKIATVSKDGVITGVKSGKCTVTVDIEGKIKKECNVDVRKSVVYLTFDDGPNAYTDEILTCLKKHKVKATFFCVGNTRYKKLYTRMKNEGHAIGLHSYSHTYSKCYASADAFINELEKLQELVYECTGEKPMIYRFPGGTNNTVAKREVMLEIVERTLDMGYSYFDWNSVSNDTDADATAQSVAKRVIGTCNESTENVLMHNKAFTVEALDIIIPALKSKGYTFKVITMDTPPIRSEVRGKGH